MTDITLTLANLSPATAEAILAVLKGGTVTTVSSGISVVVDGPAEPEKPKRARTAGKTSEPETSSEPTQPTAPEPLSSEAEASSDETAAAGTASTAMSYEKDVRPLVLELTAKRGREATVQCLAGFWAEDGKPVAKGTELKAEDWQSFINAAQALIEGDLA